MFGFFTKIWIFDQYLYLWPKFGFLTNIWIFDQNLDFWPIFAEIYNFKKGELLLRSLPNVSFTGITGTVSFATGGIRKNTVLSLYNVFDSRMSMIGNWTRAGKIRYFNKFGKSTNKTGQRKSGRTLIITTVLAPPYMELVNGLSPEIENEIRSIEPSGRRKSYPNTYYTVCSLTD